MAILIAYMLVMNQTRANTLIIAFKHLIDYTICSADGC
jgi:hypothetical protein